MKLLCAFQSCKHDGNHDRVRCARTAQNQEKDLTAHVIAKQSHHSMLCIILQSPISYGYMCKSRSVHVQGPSGTAGMILEDQSQLIGSKSRYLNNRKAKPITTDGRYLTPRDKFPPYYSYVIHIIVQIHVPRRTETACSTCQVVSSFWELVKEYTLIGNLFLLPVRHEEKPNTWQKD